MAVKDIGQDALQMDIHILLQDVIDQNFHDFNSEKYATPKLALITRLEQLVADTKAGKYDNHGHYERQN